MHMTYLCLIIIMIKISRSILTAIARGKKQTDNRDLVKSHSNTTADFSTSYNRE